MTDRQLTILLIRQPVHHHINKPDRQLGSHPVTLQRVGEEGRGEDKLLSTIRDTALCYNSSTGSAEGKFQLERPVTVS